MPDLAAVQGLSKHRRMFRLLPPHRRGLRPRERIHARISTGRSFRRDAFVDRHRRSNLAWFRRTKPRQLRRRQLTLPKQFERLIPFRTMGHLSDRISDRKNPPSHASPPTGASGERRTSTLPPIWTPAISRCPVGNRRHSGMRLLAQTRNPEPEHNASGFRVRGKTRAPE